MANTKRGEFDVVLDGETYTLIPTHQALCEIEDMTGRSVVEILSRYMKDKPFFKDVVCIISACTDLSFDEASTLVYKQGMTKMILPTFLTISNALSGERKKKEEEKGRDSQKNTTG